MFQVRNHLLSSEEPIDKIDELRRSNLLMIVEAIYKDLILALGIECEVESLGKGIRVVDSLVIDISNKLIGGFIDMYFVDVINLENSNIKIEDS